MKPTQSTVLRIIVPALLLLLAGTVQAQQEEDAPVADTAVSVIEAPAEEDTGYEEESAANQAHRYFQPTWMDEGMDSLQQRRIGDTTIANLQREDAFWYANADFKKKKTKPKSEETTSSGSVSINLLLLLLIIGAFIAFLVIFLSNSNVKLFRRSKTIREEEQPDLDTGDIFSISYDKEIDKAAAAGDYRLGVRLLFLRLLCQLADRNLIRYTPDRTNFDYLLQLQAVGWYSQFFRITRNYEYVWYGRFDIDREKFDAIRSDFKNLEKQF